MITLTNNFHNTAARVRPMPVADGRFKEYHKISRATARRVRAQLCGSTDCVCGGTFGERGGVYLQVISEDDDCNYIIDLRVSNL